MAKVTGIGGVFFKSRNGSSELAAWYQKHLGIPVQSWGGAVLNSPAGDSAWFVVGQDSDLFSPSDSVFMINYRVDDLDALIAQLQADGVELVGDPTSDDNGKFAWVLDPEGNKVELWQPAD